MCGIVGYFDSQFRGRCDEALGLQKTQTLQHRGPDGQGHYYDEAVFLGQRRLSILDLSEGGKQPFVCPLTETVVVFNGELYNHLELRRSLEAKGYRFNSPTDGIILPALYREYGRNFARLLKGIYAIAIYDRREKSLLLARDRFGIKPLYFSWQDGLLSFASEIKGVHFSPRLDYQALYDYLSLG